MQIEGMKGRRHIREVLEALEWARVERMRVGSPDFVRARVIEQQVQRLCNEMIHRKDAEVAKQKKVQRS